MYVPPKTLTELEDLSGTYPGFESLFANLHHFARPEFESRPEGFAVFVQYCESRDIGILPGHENERTIQRAYRFLELYNTGNEVAHSMEQAWAEYPTIRSGG